MTDDERQERLRSERGFTRTGSGKTRRPFALRRPCADCPFRSDIEFHLHPDRAVEIADSLRSNEAFNCHRTLDYQDDGPQYVERTNFCAGALKTVLNGGDLRYNAPMQIAERLGLFDPSKLQEDMPVFGDLDAWVDHIRSLSGLPALPRGERDPRLRRAPRIVSDPSSD